jgi:hypothetical protein
MSMFSGFFDPANNVRVVLAEGFALAHELNFLHFSLVESEADEKSEAEAYMMRMAIAWQESELVVKRKVDLHLGVLEKFEKEVEAESDAVQNHVLLVQSRQALASLRQGSRNVKDVATLPRMCNGRFPHGH